MKYTRIKFLNSQQDEEARRKIDEEEKKREEERKRLEELEKMQNDNVEDIMRRY